MTRSDKVEEIGKKLGMKTLLGQAAEEAAELSAALSKLRRKMEDTNPTPKTIEECRDAVLEEMADVKAALAAAGVDFNHPRVKATEEKKIDRWYQRVFGREAE